jgi:hypothetical protein
MTELALHRTLTWVMFGFGAATLVALSLITAPYGRHARTGWGPTTSARTGWIVMEIPAVVAFAIIYAAGQHRANTAPLVLLAIWQAHYAYRALIYPFRLGPRAMPMPWVIVLTGLVFNTFNAYLNARWISHLGDYPVATLTTPWFVAGTLIFAAGLLLNRAADRALFALRATSSGERRYSIPRGKLFERISCPNYLGEIVQWFGWAVLTWSLPGLACAVYTLANLAPRALAHHAWYRAQFADYPPKRRALVPFVL